MQTNTSHDHNRRPVSNALNIPGPRPRMQLTCEPCRLSKIKCDRAMPVCEQCRRRSRGLSCRYKNRAVHDEDATMQPQGQFVRLEHAMARSNETLTHALWNDHASVITPPPEEELGRMIGSLKLSKDGRTQLKAPSHWESIVDDVKRTPCNAIYLESCADRHYRLPISGPTLKLVMIRITMILGLGQ